MFSESLTNNTGLSRKSARCWCAKGSRPTGFARDGTGIDHCERQRAEVFCLIAALIR
jgi:hypothetical protein